MPSAGVWRRNSSSGRRLDCAATASAPYSLKLSASHRSAMFSRAVRRPSACRRATASGRCVSAASAWRSSTRCRSSRTVARSAVVVSGASDGAEPACATSAVQSASPSATVSPAACSSSRTRTVAGARNSCSIFIASRMATTSPWRTVVPGSTSHCTSWAARGARSVVMRSIVVHARAGAAGGGICRRRCGLSMRRGNSPGHRGVQRREPAAGLPWTAGRAAP